MDKSKVMPDCGFSASKVILNKEAHFFWNVDDRYYL